jgi:DNA-binding NarL/FixJ family response regulator
MIRILSVECDEQSQRALREFFARFDDLELAGDASNANEALQMLRTRAFDVVLVNLGPNDMEPIALTREIRALHPQARVLMFASAESPETIFAAMDAGADAYVLKSAPDARLEAAVRSIRLNTFGSIQRLRSKF